MNMILKKRLSFIWIYTSVFLILAAIVHYMTFPPVNLGIQVKYNKEINEGVKVNLETEPSQEYFETKTLTNYVTNHQVTFYLNSQIYDSNKWILFYDSPENVKIKELAVVSGKSDGKKKKLLSIKGEELQENIKKKIVGEKQEVSFSNTLSKKIHRTLTKKSVIKIYLYILLIIIYVIIILRKLLFSGVSNIKFIFFLFCTSLFLTYCIYILNISPHNAVGIHNFQWRPQETEKVPIDKIISQEFEASANRMSEVTFFLSKNKKLEGNGILLVSLYSEKNRELVVSKLYQTETLSKNIQKMTFEPIENSQYQKYILSFKLIEGEPGIFETRGNNYSLNDGWKSVETAKGTKDLAVEIAPGFIIFDSRLTILVVSIFLLLLLIVCINADKIKIPTKYLLFFIYISIFGYAVFQVNFYQEKYRGVPDESTHISYVSYFAENPKKIITDYKKVYLGEIDSNNGTIELKDATNYLGHPPLYYKILSLIKGVEKKGDRYLVHMNRMILLSVMFVLTSLIIMMYIGYTRIKPIPILHYLYAMILISVPMFLYGTVGITNDALTALTVVIGLFGFLRYTEKRRDFLTYFLIAIGICMSLLTKMTAGLLLVLIGLSFVFYLLLKEKKVEFLNDRKFWCSVPIYLFTICFFVLVYKKNGAFQGSYEKIAPSQFYHSVFYVPMSERVEKTFLEYIHYYFTQFFRTWTEVASAKAVPHPGPWYGVSRVGMIFIALFPFAIFFIKEKSEKIYLGKSFLIGLSATFILQFFNAVNSFYRNGYLGSYQSRYYLCAILGMALISVEILGCLNEEKIEVFRKNESFNKIKIDGKMIIQFLAGTWIVLLGYSGFIYFLIHFSN